MGQIKFNAHNRSKSQMKRLKTQAGLEDGLYRVSIPQFTAGFEVKDGKIINCAPILQRNIDYWKTVAVKVTPELPEKSD